MKAAALSWDWALVSDSEHRNLTVYWICPQLSLQKDHPISSICLKAYAYTADCRLG